MYQKMLPPGGGSSGASSADKVTFNNEGTGLVSDNVQSAIEEVNDTVERLGSMTELASMNISSANTSITQLNVEVDNLKKYRDIMVAIWQNISTIPNQFINPVSLPISMYTSGRCTIQTEAFITARNFGRVDYVDDTHINIYARGENTSFYIKVYGLK